MKITPTRTGLSLQMDNRGLNTSKVIYFTRSEINLNIQGF